MSLRQPCLLLLLCSTILVSAADSPQFRGPTRNGVYQESGLLKKWPEGGPTMLWSSDGLGMGYSSVAVSNGTIYTTGMTDYKGYLYVFDLDGKLRWHSYYGEEHLGGGYPGSRTTPTVDGDRVYLISSKGVVVCFDAKKGEKLWSVDLLERFGGGKNADDLIPRWAIAESLLIHGDKVIATPGAPDATLVALDKKTGDTVWQSEGVSDISGYCSPRLYRHNGLEMIITMTGNSIIGVNAKDGKLMFREAYSGSWDIHANSPVFQDDLIYVSDGYGKGGTAFKISPDGRKLSLHWEEDSLDIHHGGIVLVDGKIYGAANRGSWVRLDFATGKVEARGRGLGKGSIVYADGLLYGYGENGRMGIVDPKSDELRLISYFKVELGNGQHWAHPVIANGRLYIRHGDVLMAFNVKKH